MNPIFSKKHHHNQIHFFHNTAMLWILLFLAAFSLFTSGCSAANAVELVSDTALPEEEDVPTLTESQWLSSTSGQYKVSACLANASASYYVETETYTNPSQTAVYAYPQIRGMENSSVMDAINAGLFRDYLVEEINWPDAEQNSYIDCSTDPPQSLSGEVEVTKYREISYDITLMNDSLLCVLWQDRVDGSVSYVLTMDSQLFDMTTGRQIHFSDLAVFSEDMFNTLLSTEAAQEYADQHEGWWYGTADWDFGSSPAYLDESTHFYQDYFTVCFPSFMNYEEYPGYRLIEYPYSLLEEFWLPAE